MWRERIKHLRSALQQEARWLSIGVLVLFSTTLVHYGWEVTTLLAVMWGLSIAVARKG